MTESTPHINPNGVKIAKTVLMPGDPLRAQYIAENFLENVEQFNTVRNMFGYTGTYKGKEVSVMGSGMGIPSIGIYSYELYHFFDVDTIIRVAKAKKAADEIGAISHVGNVLSSDTFYNADSTFNDSWKKMGILGIEMESAGLYLNAIHANKKALGIFTVSDHILRDEATSAEERQTSFTQMMEIALEIAE